MARKSVLPSYKMFDAQAVSADVTSNITSVKNLDNCSIAVVWSGTIVGDLYVQVRNGEHDAWRNVDFGSVIPITTGSGTHDIYFTQLSYTDMRLFVDRASGSGSITATISSKTVGA